MGLTSKILTTNRSCCRCSVLKAILNGLWLALACFNLYAAPVWSEPRITLDVTPQTGSLDETFTFSVTIDSGHVTAAPVLSGGKDFKIVFIGPRSSVKIINGEVASQYSYIYQLLPRKSGALMSPEVEIGVDGVTKTLAPIAIKVGPAGNPQAMEGEDYFLRQSAAAPSVFVGQQLRHITELFTQHRMQNVRLIEGSFDGFISEPLNDNAKASRSIGGKEYSVLRLENILYPLEPGQIRLPPRKVGADLIESRRSRPRSPFDPFDDDFFQDFMTGPQVRAVEVVSNSLDLEVKPLPPPPPDAAIWRGSPMPVGETSIVASLDAAEIEIGGSKTLTVSVTSLGNLSALKNLPLSIPSWIKTYPEAPVTSRKITSAGLETTRTFRISLVPTAGGRVALDTQRLSYFDPVAGQYRTAQVALSPFTVTGAPPAAAVIAASPTSTLAAKATLYQGGELREELEERWGISFSLMILAGCLSLVLGVVGVIIWQRRRWMRPLRLARERVIRAAAVEEFESAFRGVLQLRLADVSLHKEGLRRRLEELGLPKDFRLRILYVLDELDALRFAPCRDQLGREQLAGAAKISELKALVLGLIDNWDNHDIA